MCTQYVVATPTHPNNKHTYTEKGTGGGRTEQESTPINRDAMKPIRVVVCVCAIVYFRTDEIDK